MKPCCNTLRFYQRKLTNNQTIQNIMKRNAYKHCPMSPKTAQCPPNCPMKLALKLPCKAFINRSSGLTFGVGRRKPKPTEPRTDGALGGVIGAIVPFSSEDAAALLASAANSFAEYGLAIAATICSSCCLLFVVCCLLFVGCCLLFVVCSWCIACIACLCACIVHAFEPLI